MDKSFVPISASTGEFQSGRKAIGRTRISLPFCSIYQIAARGSGVHAWGDTFVPLKKRAQIVSFVAVPSQLP
jgi:hypothetical protein